MQPFAYSAPTELDDVLESLTAHGTDAKVLAGGQSLLVMLRQRLLAPRILIDVKRVSELAGVSVVDGSLRIGAVVRHAHLASSELVRVTWPILATSAGSIGSMHIRSRGTIGGSIAHADPAADLLVGLIALDGVVETRSSAGPSEHAAADISVGVFETRVAADALITSIRIPRPQVGSTYGYARFALRAGEFPMCQAAVVLAWAADRCTGARVAVGGSAERPIRLPTVEAALIGAPHAGVAADRAMTAAVAGVIPDIRPFRDVRGSPSWKARVIQDVVSRALNQAMSGRAAA